MNDDKYWPYVTARATLITRLHATDDEIRMWAYLGHEDGGIDGFNDPHDYKDDAPPKRHFTASEVGAFFLREQIESFKPDDSRRYLSLRELIERWEAHGLPTEKVKKLVHNLVDDDRLEPINALRGETAYVSDPGGEYALIPDLSLFARNQVHEVEAREFISVESDPELSDTNPEDGIVKPDEPWITFCKVQIDNIFQSRIASGKAATKEYIAEELVGRCKRGKYITKRNIPVSKDNVLKHVLKGWTAPEIE